MEGYKCGGGIYLSRERELAVSKDMPDSGLSCGDAYYSFSYSDIICVTQGNSSVEFEIEVDQNELKIFFMGQEYLELEK